MSLKFALEQNQDIVPDYRNGKEESGSECSTFERMTSKSPSAIGGRSVVCNQNAHDFWLVFS